MIQTAASRGSSNSNSQGCPSPAGAEPASCTGSAGVSTTGSGKITIGSKIGCAVGVARTAVAAPSMPPKFVTAGGTARPVPGVGAGLGAGLGGGLGAGGGGGWRCFS